MAVQIRRLKVPMTPSQLANELRKDGFRVRRRIPLSEATYMRWDFFLTNEPALWVNGKHTAAHAAFDALHESSEPT
jgi:hypothetical protein